MGERTEEGSKKLSRLKTTASVMAGLIVPYAVIGFLDVPPIIKSQLQTGMSETLRAQATVTDVAMNPIALSLILKGLRLNSADGEPFAGFEELYIYFQQSSLFCREYTFDEIRFNAFLKNVITQREHHSIYQFITSPGKGGTLKGEGTVSVDPVLSRGNTAVQRLKMRTCGEYIRDPVNFEATDGSTDVKTRHEIGIKNNDIVLEPDEGTLKLMDFRMNDKDAPETLMFIPVVECSDIRVAYPRSEISVDSIMSGDAGIIGWRSREVT